MTFSFDVSNIFKESPPGGRSTATSMEPKPGKVATTQPVAESDPSAEDAGTRNVLKCYASGFGDGSQPVVLRCIPCNLRALTNSDGWGQGSRALSLIQGFQMLCIRCVDSGVLSDPDSGFVSTSLGYGTGLLFRT